MDCTFSNPVDYEGNTPSSTLQTFNFKSLHCDLPPTGTPSAYTSTSSGTASPSGDLLQSYGDFARIEIFAIAIVIFLLAGLLFLNIFKR